MGGTITLTEVSPLKVYPFSFIMRKRVLVIDLFHLVRMSQVSLDSALSQQDYNQGAIFNMLYKRIGVLKDK